MGILTAERAEDAERVGSRLRATAQDTRWIAVSARAQDRRRRPGQYETGRCRRGRAGRPVSTSPSCSPRFTA